MSQSLITDYFERMDAPRVAAERQQDGADSPRLTAGNNRQQSLKDEVRVRRFGLGGIWRRAHEEQITTEWELEHMKKTG